MLHELTLAAQCLFKFLSIRPPPWRPFKLPLPLGILNNRYSVGGVGWRELVRMRTCVGPAMLCSTTHNHRDLHAAKQSTPAAKP